MKHFLISLSLGIASLTPRPKTPRPTKSRQGGNYGKKTKKKSRTGIYHIILRGVNRQTIFEEDADKYKLLETLTRYKKISKFHLYGYCLMDNHIHLLMKETEEAIGKTIQRISASYVRWYNYKYERIGHLFQGRFKSENVETPNYFRTVLRYIHQNPVKARLEMNVLDCKWTSIHDYIHQPTLIDIDLGLNLFSPDRNKAIQIFTDFMQQSNDDQCLEIHIPVKISDDEVRDQLNELGIPHTSLLQQMEREQRNEIILMLKQLQGVTARQLARVTGISKSVIDRVR